MRDHLYTPHLYFIANFMQTQISQNTKESLKFSAAFLSDVAQSVVRHFSEGKKKLEKHWISPRDVGPE